MEQTTEVTEDNSSKVFVRPRPEECKICRRPGHGHHYGVASCKGCKTFFRRISVSNTELKCQLSNDCFDNSKRAQLQLRCQSCRYRKCIDVGMNPLALELKKGEDQFSNYMEARIKVNRNKQDNEPPGIQVIVSKQASYKNMIDMLTYLELKIDLFKNSAYNPPFIDWQRSTEDLITCSSKLSLSDRLGVSSRKFLVSIGQLSKSLQPMKGWPLMNKNDLPEVSRMRDLPDLKPRFQGPNYVPEPYPTNEYYHKLFSASICFGYRKMWMFYNMMTTIEYAKTFTFFHDLDLKDQTILISHVTLICMNLHNSYFAVSRKMEKCMHPDGIELPQRDEYHYTVLSMAMAPLIRCNIQPVEYVLLKAICLCNPTVHGISERAQSVIGNERQKYADILLDLCLRNRTDGPSRFVELLGIISILVHQQRLQKDIHILHIAPIIAKFPFSVQFLEEIMYS